MAYQEGVKLVEAGHNCVVTGQAGTGKSYFLRNTISKITSKGKRVAVLCPTGIAATQFLKGTTVHRYTCKK